jgi:prevent-host-death family protein
MGRGPGPGGLKWGMEWLRSTTLVDTHRATTYNVREAKTHFSRLLARVLAGEEVVIAKAGEPIARIVPIRAAPIRREPDTCRGQIWVAEDFDAPLPEDLLDAFEGRT